MSAHRRGSHLERVLGRLDNLDQTNLTILVQRLARERELLETVFNNINEAILVITREGRIEYANTASLQLIGLKQSEVGQANLWRLVPELARTLKSQLESGVRVAPSLVRELEILYPERRQVRLYVVPFEDPEGLSEGRFTVILSDVSELKASTEQRIEDERLGSIFELAGGVAHEIGNPLNSLNIHLQLLKRQLAKLPNDAVGREKLEAGVGTCLQEVERLDGIITHFLKAIRPMPPDLHEVQVVDVLTEVLEVQAPEMHDLNIEVVLEVKTPPPLVMADHNQLKQLFFNVTKNAMEAMDAGGKLTLSAASDDEWVYIYVADTGVGISQDAISKVFQPYYTSKKGGHGLGMLVVRRILRDHGGIIGIDSRPGIGTLVTLQLPLPSRRWRRLETKADPPG